MSKFKFIFAQFSRLKGEPSRFWKAATPQPSVVPGQLAHSQQDHWLQLPLEPTPPECRYCNAQLLHMWRLRCLHVLALFPQTPVLAVSMTIPSTSPITLRTIFSYNFKLLKELMGLWNTWVLKNREFGFGQEKRLRLEISSSLYKVTIQVVTGCCYTFMLENPKRTEQSSLRVLEINNALNLGAQMPGSLCSKCKPKQHRSPDIQFPISSLPQTQSLGKPARPTSSGLMVKLWQQHFGSVAWETRVHTLQSSKNFLSGRLGWQFPFQKRLPS